MRFTLSDLSYSYHGLKQAEKDLHRQENRLRRNGLTRQQIDDCTGPLVTEMFMCLYEYKEIRSRKWQREARKLCVPLTRHPRQQDAVEDPTDHWEFLHSLGAWAMTDTGIHHIRHEIREVQKSEHERWLRWAMPAIAVLALIVSIISISSTFLA